ncbi:MAG TPA: crosslink repair DNA glycosylase YcaQ family protein [Rubrobacter sp.]|nr:crosslink repair DNA glycosylase YcaQ family protein [Rubrobacter sp.]
MSAADRVLTLRELNRATLARQMLLGRKTMPVLDAVERLVGLQAQIPSPPYGGLWTRLTDFRREELTRSTFLTPRCPPGTLRPRPASYPITTTWCSPTPKGGV